HLPEQLPVGLGDLDHRVQACVVLVPALCEPEVGALSGMCGNEVSDDRDPELLGDARYSDVLLVRPEQRIDAELDAIEEPIDGGCVGTTADPTSPLHRTHVDRFDANLPNRRQQGRASQRLENRLVLGGDERPGIIREPDRRCPSEGRRRRTAVRVSPLNRLARDRLRELVSPAQHGARLEPPDVVRTRLRGTALCVIKNAAGCAAVVRRPRYGHSSTRNSPRWASEYPLVLARNSRLPT